ncbi:hypothetical protein TrRE_jg12537 [Triparma retinervis]|uniref:dolichol kinase n=1 Tax=Triparma retinervis TaxID=2557542 RepID=A0A9W6ZCI9_9STRA|nr:hypothetical protein TrRE_jg12537 [Triparma retinervis]
MRSELIHTLSIPLFLLVWPFFSQSDPYSNYVAATVPMANMWKIISAGQGGEDGLGKAVSRSGDEKEMAAGDGMADIIGRRFGSTKWRPSSLKSVQGTLGFIVAASLATLALLTYYSFVTSRPTGLGGWDLAARVAGISVVCGIVETAEVGDDNFTVPIAGTVLGGYLIGWAW